MYKTNKSNKYLRLQNRTQQMSMDRINEELASLKVRGKSYITHQQYRDLNGKLSEVEFLLEPHKNFIQDYECIRSAESCLSMDACGRLFPALRGLDLNVPCVSLSLSKAIEKDSDYVWQWMTTMNKWVKKIKPVDPVNRLPIQQYMFSWYTRIMSGKVRGLTELQESAVRASKNKLKAYVTFLNANRGFVVGAFLILCTWVGFSAGPRLPNLATAGVGLGFGAWTSLRLALRYAATIRKEQSISKEGQRPSPSFQNKSHSKSKSKPKHNSKSKSSSEYNSRSNLKFNSKSNSK
jgi:hypothetical protein